MSTKLELTRRWIEAEAAKYNLPTAVVEEIYNSQSKFLREHLTGTDPKEFKNIHIRGLGKIYIRDKFVKSKYEQAS
jgi:hypothetical protein